MFSQSLYFKNVILMTAQGVRPGALRVSGKKITAIDGQQGPGDKIIDGRGGVMLPGLINAHDHLELNTFSRLKYRACYTHSRQWIEDIEARFASDPALTEPRRQPLADRLLLGALKNLLSGVTTVCHHNPLHRPLRRGYPIRVVKNYGFCHSLFRGDDPLASYRRTPAGDPWIIHLAEGVDAEAEAEFEQLGAWKLLQPNTVLVHGAGLTPEQRQTLIARGGGLIWCPSSNLFLFGQTAQVKELSQAGKLALGSDSRLSGEGDLLAELRAAHQTGQLSPQALFRSVTVDAARLLRLREGGRGDISVGAPADLVLLPPPLPPDPFARLLDLRRAQIGLVMLAGKPLLGSPQLQAVFEATKTRFGSVYVDGTEKLMPQTLITRVRTASVQEPGLQL